MKRVNIEDAFVGEPSPSQAGVEAQDSDEAIVLAVRGGEVVAVAQATPIKRIAGLLAEKKFKRVPVVDDGALVGMVSRADIVRALAAKA